MKDAPLKAIENMSEEELKSLIKAANEALNKIREDQLVELRSRIGQIAADLEISFDQLIELISPPAKGRVAKKGAKLKIKYQHPNDPSLTWSGAGSTPKWMRKLFDQGMTKEDLLIKK